jgi:hypothetical protein
MVASPPTASSTTASAVASNCQTRWVIGLTIHGLPDRPVRRVDSRAAGVERSDRTVPCPRERSCCGPRVDGPARQARAALARSPTRLYAAIARRRASA